MGANFYEFTYQELARQGIYPCPTIEASLGRPQHDDFFKQTREFNFEYTVESKQFSKYLGSNGEIELLEVDKWCQENLLGFFKIDDDRSSFEYEDDAMAFKLTWY